VFNESTTGAQSDLKVVTEVARRMVCEFGMSDAVGNITLEKREGPVFLGRDIVEEKHYSEQTAILIDKEVRKVIDECYARGRELLVKYRDKLDLLANELLEKEVLEAEQVKQILKLPDETEKDDKSLSGEEN
jgi:cell division protease FtsH